MNDIFKPVNNENNRVFAGCATLTAWFNHKHDVEAYKGKMDCNKKFIFDIPVSFIKDDKGEWKKADKTLRKFISKLKNPVMIVKEFAHDFIKTTTPDRVMKFGVYFKNEPSILLGVSFDDSEVLKGSTNDYYFYQSDVLRFIIFDDSVENEKKMREIL